MVTAQLLLVYGYISTPISSKREVKENLNLNKH